MVVRPDRQFADLVRLARAARVPVQIEPKRALDRLVPGGKHQGVVGVAAAKPYCDLLDILRYAHGRGEAPFLIILDGVEDPHNLGAVIRTADAVGAHGVILPERRAAGLTASVAKTSAGALEHVRVARAPNVSRVIETLQAEGLWVYALDPQAVKPYTNLDLAGPIALVLGGEGKGIRPGVLEKCDEIACIPMRGHIESLNVSVASAVLMYEVLRQRMLQAKNREK
jgi:23S rRNA (guanosine2251-2'-O)-methyltransferase